MKLRIERKGDNAIDVHVEGEDISLSQIVREELLNDPRVVFAGTTEPHPLIKENIIRVQTSKGDPVKVMIECAGRAKERAKEMLKAFKSVLREG